jgi:signal transduction histidine kinase
MITSPKPRHNATMPLLPPSLLTNYRRSMAYRAVGNQVVCLVAAVTFWLLAYSNRSFWHVYLYSFAIGNLIWLSIDLGRSLAARWKGLEGTEWPGALAMAVIIAGGTVLGYNLGTALVAALLGHRKTSLFADAPSAFLTLLIAVGTTYFFYMRERLHRERADADAARRQALESQLDLLQSQLEPHMLFNTLANLRVLITLDPPRAQAMLDHLIGFLRVTLAASRVPRHPLGAEFDRTRDYLALMAVRMGPRLQVQLDLPADLVDLQVPPLLLQPLVENSIKHGLEPKVEGGRIEVSARREGGHLLLEVLDNGVGLSEPAPLSMPAPTGEHVPARPKPASGFGLEQVRDRLAALYGPRAELVLVPSPDGVGTLARIRLPADGEGDAPKA